MPVMCRDLARPQRQTSSQRLQNASVCLPSQREMLSQQLVDNVQEVREFRSLRSGLMCGKHRRDKLTCT